MCLPPKNLPPSLYSLGRDPPTSPQADDDVDPAAAHGGVPAAAGGGPGQQRHPAGVCRLLSQRRTGHSHHLGYFSLCEQKLQGETQGKITKFFNFGGNGKAFFFNFEHLKVLLLCIIMYYYYYSTIIF